MFSSLRAKLTFSHLGVIFLTASIFAFITFVVDLQIYKHSTFTTLHKSSINSSIIIANYLSNKQNLLKKISESREIELYSKNFQDVALAAYFARFTDEFMTLSYIAPTGNEEVRMEHGLLNESLRDFSQDPNIREATKNPGIFLLTVTSSQSASLPTSLIFTLADQRYFDDKITHIIQASISITMLENHLKNRPQSGAESLIVVDSTNMVLIHPQKKYLSTKLQLPSPNQGFGELNQLGMKGIYDTVESVFPAWKIISVIPFHTYWDAPIRYAKIVFAIFCCVVLLGILFVNFIARKITKPVIALTKAVTMLSNDHKIEVLPPYHIEELDNLVKAFNTLSFDLTETTISKVYLNNILNSLRECLIVTSLNGTIESANQMTFDLIGYRQEDLIGQPINTLFPENFDIETCLISGRDEEELETSFITQDKKEIPIVLTRAYLKNEYGLDQGIVCLALDIRKKKTIEDEKEKLTIQLQRAQRLETVGTLASGIAHDFNNILTIIVGYSQMLNYTIKDEESKKSLEQIIAASNRATKLVQQLLEFSRQGAHTKMEISLASIIKEIVKMLKSSTPASIDIRQQLDANCSPIMADPSQLQQIIMNLCSNAIHAIGDYGTLTIKLDEEQVTESNTSQYQAVPLDSYVKLRICDTGHGIKKENLERIFDPFFTTKTVDKGTGLGLAVVHGMIQGMDGHIFVTSKESEGTTFTLLFPALNQKVSQERDPVEAASSHILHGKGAHILFVDDEKALVVLGKRNLEHMGYKVTATTASQEALELFRENPSTFDLLITDFSMPKMQGDRLIEEIKKIRSDLPVILCTGYHAKLITTRAIQGVHKTVEKPYSTERLAREVYNILNS